MIEDFNYDNIVISIKSSDVMMCVRAHQLIAEETHYPLHVGITEAGTVFSGNIKSSVGLALIPGRGDRGYDPRLPDRPPRWTRCARRGSVLRTLGLQRGGIEVVSCPTCRRRDRIDLIPLAARRWGTWCRTSRW